MKRPGFSICVGCARNTRSLTISLRETTHLSKKGQVRVVLSLQRYHAQRAVGQNEPRQSIPSHTTTSRRQFSNMAPRQSTATSSANSTSSPPGDAGPSDRTQAKPKRSPPTLVRPSSSILLISQTNQVLLLHRVQTSTSFASAHVFPGGNLSSFHEGPLPDAGSDSLHEDSRVYRLAAVRETFEESGILLAKKKDGDGVLEIPDEVREAGRKAVHRNTIRFVDWLDGVGGVPDTDVLIPFTRWITPPNGPNRRFSTQMYIYMLPLFLADSSSAASTSLVGEGREIIIPTPTHDGGLEHTAAAFDDASNWISRARAGEIILFPPQFFLLHIVSQFFRGSGSGATTTSEYQAQREALIKFLNTTPTVRSDSPPQGKVHATASIPWAEKVMSPTVLFLRKSDRRVVLGLDKPGPELEGSKRGGDWDRVVLVNFRKEGPRDVEVRWREDVLWEEREAEGKEQQGGAKL